MAFTTLNPPDDNDGDNQARFETLAALLESAPDGVNANLLERVASEQNQLLSIVNDEEWKMLRDRTRGYIANPEKAPIDEIKEDIATLISYSNTGETSRRDEVKKLVRDLQRILIQYKAAEQGISLPSRIQLITKLKEKDPNLFQTAMSEILSEVRLTRANLALFGSGDESLDMLDKQLTAELKDQQIKALNDQESVRAKLVRNYQKYALQSIKRFNQRYANREKITNDVLTRIREGNRLANDYDDLPSVQYAIMNAKYRKIEGRVYDTEEYILGTTDSLESDLNYYVCRDAMVSHLLPIDLRLTEMPIQDLFQKAWQSGWENLDGREDQTVVAVRTADVKKKTLTDVQVEK